MSAPLTAPKEYSVRLIEWNEWQIWLTAASAEEAEAEAIRIISEEGTDEFKHRGSGIDHIEAEEVQS